MALGQESIRRLVRTIYERPELNGTIVGLYDDRSCALASAGNKVALAYWERAVIIEVVPDPADLSASTIETASTKPALVKNSSKLGAELIGVGLSCTFTAASAVGFAGAAAAEVPTLGGATFVAAVAWTGLVTSGIQCINGIVRVGAIVSDADATTLSEWDENKIYSVSMLVVDAIGLGAGAVSLTNGMRSLLAVLERRGNMVSAQALASMGRDRRAATIQRALAEASRNPESRMVLDAAMEEALNSARTARRVTSNPIIAARNSRVVGEVISRETTRRLQRSLVEVVAGIAQPIASGLPPGMVGSASGVVYAAINASFSSSASSAVADIDDEGWSGESPFGGIVIHVLARG